VIKNIIFDMGGVIVDVQLNRAIEKFEAMGVANAGELIDASHHKGIFMDFEKGNVNIEQFGKMLSNHVGKEISQTDIAEAWKSMISTPPAYKMDYIRNLRKSYRLFILTNNNPVIIGWACSKGFTPSGDSMADYFDKLYVSYQMKCTKPDLKIYRMLIEDAGINPAETLFIDDSECNLVPARETGMQTLLVENGSDWRNELNEKLKHLI
jgi:putative hydrolase of the HAD superfamily